MLVGFLFSGSVSKFFQFGQTHLMRKRRSTSLLSDLEKSTRLLAASRVVYLLTLLMLFNFFDSLCIPGADQSRCLVVRSALRHSYCPQIWLRACVCKKTWVLV